MNYKINEICRLCLANSNLMIAIFSENSTYVNNMALKIMSIASVEVDFNSQYINYIFY